MVSIQITEEEMEKFKQIAKAYKEGGEKAANEKAKELNLKFDKPEFLEEPTKENICNHYACLGCVSCGFFNPAFLALGGFCTT